MCHTIRRASFIARSTRPSPRQLKAGAWPYPIVEFYLGKRSAEDMAALIHPDFLYVTAGGKTLTKADYIDVAVNGRFVYHDQ